MILQNYYYYFKEVLTPKFCDEVIELGKLQQEKIALTGNFEEKENLSKKEIKDLKKIRNSNIAWLNDAWIYNEIQPYIHQANKEAGWNFNWDWSESCQFTKYKLNQFYNWHSDSWEKPYDTPDSQNTHGKIRKLSVTCSLSDPKDYKGGELEFDFRNKENGKPSIKKCMEILPRGSIVVFPSHVWHRVRPVNKGTRYSLVIWNLGYPFK
jgi:PKHD-type hydroxylase